MPGPAGSTARPERDGSSDLRRRRRLRTKTHLQDEALALFAERGYDATSVEDIAHAAAISPRTFYRYFTCKEDVVLWAEHEDLPPEELWDGAPAQDPYLLLVRRLRELTVRMYRDDPERLLRRTRLSYTVPQLRTRMLDRHFDVLGTHYTRFAAATGLARDDLRLTVRLGAAVMALLVAMENWQRNDGRPNLPELLDQALSALAVPVPGDPSPGPAATG